jgi:hypothetical protein
MSRLRNVLLLAAVMAGLATTVAAEEASPYVSTACGTADALPPGYVPPLVSNGNLSMLVDYQGGQTQRAYAKMTPCIWWAGRRYGPPRDRLVPFGHFTQQLTCNGQTFSSPTRWSQTLDTRQALTTTRCDYGDLLQVETTVFVPLDRDLVAVRKRLTPKSPAARSARIAFQYRFTPSGAKNVPPWRTVATGVWNADTTSVDVAYQVDGHRLYDGAVALFCDRAATAQIDKQAYTLTADVALDAARPAEITFYLAFADSVDGRSYRQRVAQLRAAARSLGFDGLFASHRRLWGEYWAQSQVAVPLPRIGRAYCTAQYFLRANATRWSFPVGIFDTHWAGRYFGWDEMFCYLGLASSNHLDIARRVPEFRFGCLRQALYRTSHYFKNTISYGARYPWETLEDGSEAAPPGFWHDHVFHMSNIALCSWFQYLYTGDRAYLKEKGYPVVRECATFFQKQMVYEDSNGSMFLGKCTDLERLGPTRQNPFMTSCGAIFAMEAAARAAQVLGVDVDQAATWTRMAAKLRQSLPHNGDQYVPYAGCPERSIAVLGGVFPYPVLDPRSPLQKNAIYDFVKNCGAFGNMYPVGNSVSAWYGAWMANALAPLGDRSEAVNRLAQVAQGTGCFAEIFEINEPTVVMHPWFSTAAGNYVYALNQVLLQSHDAEIRIAPAVPASWREFSFTLPCYGNLLATVSVKDGRLTQLRLVSGQANEQVRRTLVIPQSLLDPSTLDRRLVTATTTRDGCHRVDVQFHGKAQLVGGGQ